MLALDAVTLQGLTGLPAKLYLTSNMIFVCIIWTVFYVVNIRTRRAREMEANLREAQLRALEGQVNPHFLFNSLNTIRGMIIEDPRIAQDMVTRLANILRYSLQRDRTYTVPLEREIEVVADYLAIESIRFDDRLRVRMEIDLAAAGAQGPVDADPDAGRERRHARHRHQDRSEARFVIRAVIRNGALAMEIVNSGQLSAPAEGTTQIVPGQCSRTAPACSMVNATLRLENPRRVHRRHAMVSIPA